MDRLLEAELDEIDEELIALDEDHTEDSDLMRPGLLFRQRKLTEQAAKAAKTATAKKPRKSRKKSTRKKKG